MCVCACVCMYEHKNCSLFGRVISLVPGRHPDDPAMILLVIVMMKECKLLVCLSQPCAYICKKDLFIRDEVITLHNIKVLPKHHVTLAHLS